MITFILGGARSGKSRFAQSLASDLEQSNLPVYYIATATAFDEEMKNRIIHHQNSRPAHWKIIEEPIELANTIQDLSQNSCIILVDCLTLWLNNLLLDNEHLLVQETNQLIKSLEYFSPKCHLILVSNETGLGVIPMGQLTRQFVDESGFLHQKVAKIADQVVFCVAGLPMKIK